MELWNFGERFLSLSLATEEQRPKRLSLCAKWSLDYRVAMEEGEEMSYDIKSILSSPERDFLIRNNGEQVKVDSLSGKNIGLYFSTSVISYSSDLDPDSVDFYTELCPQGIFEIIFVPILELEDEISFNKYFSEKPWLAIPLYDSKTCDRLLELFKFPGWRPPFLVMLDGNGKFVSRCGSRVLCVYGMDAYPFTSERITEVEEQWEAAKMSQSLTAKFVSQSRDFLISNDGTKVPVSELEGKTIGLYFFSSGVEFIDFTLILVEVYEKLKERGENFEVVLLVSLKEDCYYCKEEYEEAFQKMPWLALPFKDMRCQKLTRCFGIEAAPGMLVIIGPDGKILKSIFENDEVVAYAFDVTENDEACTADVTDIVETHGVEAYPFTFTPERLEELAEMEKARVEAQTLESVLVLGERDFVISKEGTQIPVSRFVGKNILLYFSRESYLPCPFLPKLIKSYHEIKAKDGAFEVIFISCDNDQASFDEFFSKMPWFALPFGDERKKFLYRRWFKIVIGCGPTAIAFGPTGKTITTGAKELLMAHGADAYPFTEEHLKEIAKEMPKKVKHVLHEDELVLTRFPHYRCFRCEEFGIGWSFSCEQCCWFCLHPKCALEKDRGERQCER